MPRSPVDSLRSGRNVGENLIAATSACPWTKEAPLPCEDCAMIVNVTHTRKNMIHPPVVGSYRLDKLLGGIPAGSSDFPTPQWCITTGFTIPYTLPQWICYNSLRSSAPKAKGAMACESEYSEGSPIFVSTIIVRSSSSSLLFLVSPFFSPAGSDSIQTSSSSFPRREDPSNFTWRIWKRQGHSTFSSFFWKKEKGLILNRWSSQEEKWLNI